MLKSAIWWTTWACNFKCAYCWQVQAQREGMYLAGKFGEPAKWLEAWQRLAPEILDVTGGEPFLVPGLVDILSGLPSSIRLGLTTNLTHDLSDFLERVPPDRFVQVTCSLHPTQPKFNEVVFYGRALQLKNRGYPVMINFVGWPEQLWLAEHYRRITLERGLRFHFDPYSGAYQEVRWSEQERAEIARLRGPDREPHPFSSRGNYDVLCSGGMEHLSVHPDGTAFRCLLDQQWGLPSVGNVFDPAFKPNDSTTPCSEHPRCPGCDRDKVVVTLKL